MWEEIGQFWGESGLFEGRKLSALREEISLFFEEKVGVRGGKLFVFGEEVGCFLGRKRAALWGGNGL